MKSKLSCPIYEFHCYWCGHEASFKYEMFSLKEHFKNCYWVINIRPVMREIYYKTN